MTGSETPHLSSRMELICRVPSVAVILVGCSALAGWLFDVAALKSVMPGLATMKVNTVLAFALAGLSLCWSQTELRVQQGLGAEEDQTILTNIRSDPVLTDIALPGIDGLARSILSPVHRRNRE
jgi:hypothetical protein